MPTYLVKQANQSKLNDKIGFAISRGKPHIIDLYIDYECDLLGKYFRDSAIIEADTLDEAFEHGNFSQDLGNDKVKILDKFHSVSVGDVLENTKTKERYIVSPIGFTKM